MPDILKRVIPKGTYPGVDYDVQGVGLFTHLIISAKLPDDLVYKITKILANNLPRFGDVVKDMKGVTPKDLAFDVGSSLPSRGAQVLQRNRSTFKPVRSGLQALSLG